jgi:hypothetical protein
MSDTRELLVKIKDLRQRLAQVQGLVGEATQAATALLGAERRPGPSRKRRPNIDTW